MSDIITDDKKSSTLTKFKNMSINESLGILETKSSVGLTINEVEHRISKHGYNEIQEKQENRIIVFKGEVNQTNTSLMFGAQKLDLDLSSLLALAKCYLQ